MESKVRILGDTHLGCRFTNGVPLSRRGQREEMIWQQFERSLWEHDQSYDLHVHLGDLFDAAVVPYDDILRAYHAYRSASERFPNTTFIVLRGNHDLLRDLEKVSAFDLFAKLVEGLENVQCVYEDPLVIGDHAFVGYTPIKSATELLSDDLKGVHTLFGHYDVQSFGNPVPNLVPTERAAELGIEKIITGHVHKPETFTRDGVEVVVWGSMQPYAHGQEVDDSLYVTLTLDQLDGADLKDKCVRVRLAPGESLDRDLDCLQLTILRQENETVETPEVSLGDFNLDQIFKDAFTEAGVSAEQAEVVMNAYSNLRLSH